MWDLRAWRPWLLLAVLPVLAHLPAFTPWFRFDPLFLISGLTQGTWQSNGWLAGYPGWIDGNAGVTTEALGHLAARQWLTGQVPWWNHFSGVGLPLAAEGQTTALFLPFGLLLALPHGLLLLRVLLVALAGLFSHALLRRMGLGALPAFIGAVFFELNGTFAWFAHGPIMPVAFLPLILLGLEQARFARFPAAAGLGTAWSFLAGFPETAALNLLFAGLWAALRVVQAPHRMAYTLRVGGAVACGLLLAAPAIWPFLQALPRQFLGAHGGVIGGGWRVGNLALMLFPYSHGGLMADIARGPATEWAWFRTGGYVDVVLAALALAALRQRGPEIALRFTLAAWVAVTAAKGMGWRPVEALFGLVPLLRQANVHLYVMSSWSMVAAVLAAFCVQDWQDGRRLNWQLAAIILCPLAVLGLAWSQSSIAAAPVALAIAAIAMPLVILAALAWLLFAAPTSGRAHFLACLLTAQATAYFMLPLFAGTHGRKLDVPAIQFLQARTAMSRVVSFGPLVPNYGAMFGVADPSHNYLPVPQLWVDAIRARIDPTTDGVNFYAGGLPDAATLNRVLPAYQAMGAAYALTWPWQGFPPSPGGPALVYQDGVMRIWALPNPERYAAAPGCTVTGTRDTLLADCGVPSTLLRQELFWPGWTAQVNGAATPVTKAEIFQQVALPAGRSMVVFRYAPPGIEMAWLACAAGATGLLSAAFGTRLLRLASRPRHRLPLMAPSGGAT